ncbi:uncharacterized protein PV09_04898 [Verruconis gallopava]|uniref:Dynactin subunit 2 n=1 Tax=Verruconis gallopava TaxID=253628 RepID=A0A0D1XND0_9PEZI|nr:uncharacterized protein PV09_04898 [Verruconis gallopava]KIW04081.1 hypothetical protein PV09_04898 [Verruconis gallopava]
MAAARKYAALPDLDQAPDVYETPDLADDVSTIPATSARSPSVGSDGGRAADEDDDESGVVRTKVDRDRAFSRFQDSKVNARKADFSDRLNSSRQYYKTSSRRRRRKAYTNGHDGEYDELSDDEEEETLDHKLARLKREIEEARIELAEKDEDRELFSDAPENRIDDDMEEHTLDSISKLSEALDAIYTSRNGFGKGPAGDLIRTISKLGASEVPARSTQTQAGPIAPPTASSLEQQAQLAQAFAKVAEFDTRLSFLEHALGLSGESMSSSSSDLQKPILQTLATLDRQIQTLTNSSASVDAASSKTRKLIEQTEHLLKAKSEYDAINHPTTDDAENVSKINALHGTLATIDSLAPTLPLVLDRMRTLRLLHANAAEAGSILDGIEKRQAEQASEIKQWREALDQVEKKVKSGESELAENIKGVESWVKELEARMSKLS